MSNLDTIDPRNFYKFLMIPEIVHGYFGRSFKAQPSESQARDIIQKKQDALISYIQKHFVGDDVEVTFYDKESYDWWSSLLDNIIISQGLVWDMNSRTQIPIWTVTIPKPPKIIFEL